MAKFLRFSSFSPDKPVITWHVDDKGIRWRRPPQGDSRLLEISDEGRVFTPEYYGWYYAFPNTDPLPTASYDVHWGAKVLTVEAGNPSHGVAAHWQSISTSTISGYVLHHTGVGQKFALVRTNTGGEIWSVPFQVAVGDAFSVVWKIRETASSVDHEVWVNGSLLGSYSDTSASRVTGGGHVGLRLRDAEAGKGSQPTYLAVVAASVADGAPDAASAPASVSLSVAQESQASHMATISGGSGRTRWELHRGTTAGFVPDRESYDTLVRMVDDGSTTTARAWHRYPTGTTVYYKAVAVNDAGTKTSGAIAITQAAPVYPPTFTRLNGGAPIFTENDVPVATIYWPRPSTNAQIIAALGKKYMWLWSLDHGGSGALYMGTSSDLLCTDFAYIRPIWTAADAGSPWTQIETPYYVHNPDSARPHWVYYQAINTSLSVQRSRLITSADLVNWTDEGTVLEYGTPHTGYIKPKRFGPGNWGAIHLLEGGPSGKNGYSTSTDGKNWTLVEEIDNWTALRDIGKNFGGLAEWIVYGGHKWAISSMQDPGESGGGGSGGDIIATMEVVGNATYVGALKELLLPRLGESGNPNETSNIRWSAPYVEGSDVYLIYATDEEAGSGEPYSVFIAQMGTSSSVPPSISINQGSSAQLEVGQTLQLTVSTSGTPAPSVTYSSSDPGVATVTSGGLVTAVAAGTATITATATNSAGTVADTITITVVPVGTPDPLPEPWAEYDYCDPYYAEYGVERYHYAVVREGPGGQSVERTQVDVIV